MTEKNFGLTEIEFITLSQELKNGKEGLFEKIFLSQFEDSIRYLQIKFSISRENSYDICMDSILYMRKLIIADKINYGNLRHLLNTISSQHFLKQKKKSRRLLFVGEMPESAQESNILEKKETEDLLNKAWKRLGSECQFLLKSFYYDNFKLYEIAEKVGKTPTALRKQKERCINALRMNFRQPVKS